MGRKWWEIPGVGLLMLGLAVLSTYPLVLHFDTGIPYSPFWGTTVWNRSGDQIQLLYWFWLVKENFIGAVPFNSNPYEFNMLIPNESPGLNTIPLAFLYMLFSPLGDIAAYNCTIISSYVLAGVFMYLLVRLYSGNRAGALLGAVIFTFAPSRINGFTAGHGYGLLYFLYPFILYFLEKGIRSTKIRYGLLSGLGLISLSMLEPHLIYYICVFLGIYIPFRVLTLFPLPERENPVAYTAFEKKLFSMPPILSFFLLIGAGVAAVIYAHVLFTYRIQNPLVKNVFWAPVLLYPFIPVLIAFCLASVIQRVSPLGFRQGLAVEAGAFLPLFLLLPLAFLFSFNDQPLETALVVGAAAAMVLVTKLVLLRNFLFTMLKVLANGLVAERKHIWPILPVVVSMGLVVAWIVFSKVDQVASTIAGGGRRLDDVGLFSSQLTDVILSTSNVYVGIIPAALFGFFFIKVISTPFVNKDKRSFGTEADQISLFYTVIAFFCYILSLGVAFGNSSLYILFFYYFPFFNYPRVSDRIITLVLFALAIVIGFVLKDIQQRLRNRLAVGAVTVLVLAAAGFQLKDYNVFKPMGINILDRGQDIYRYVKDNIGDGLLLEIPLWPGDSHQSSLYQHYIMLDRVPRVNGCSPLVLKEYVKTVFTPLNDINQGRLKKTQYELLQKLGVKYITVHDNRDVFLPKVSPFVPLTTVRRLSNSPYLEVVNIDNKMYFKSFTKKRNRLHLFRVKSVEEIQTESGQAWYDMPYIYDPYTRLHSQTGGIVEDKQIGRWVFEADEESSKPGFLVYGPYDVYPPGDYRCVFNISSQAGQGQAVARAEVSAVSESGDIEVLAQQEIQDIKGEDGYRKIYLDFSIEKDTKLELRVFYYGKGVVRVEKIAMYQAGKDKQLSFLEAEKMVGNSGLVAFEQDASGGKVVEAIAGDGKTAKGEMVYGPNLIYLKGRYTARFLLRTKSAGDCDGKEVAAVLSITDEKNQVAYASRAVDACELGEQEFTPVEVDFTLSRDAELSFRVYFPGTVSLQLDGIDVVQH